MRWKSTLQYEKHGENERVFLFPQLPSAIGSLGAGACYWMCNAECVVLNQSCCRALKACLLIIHLSSYLGNCIFLQRRITLRLHFPPYPQGTPFEVFLKKEIKQESPAHDVPVRGTNLSSVHSAFCVLKLVWSIEAFGQAIKIIGPIFTTLLLIPQTCVIAVCLKPLLYQTCSTHSPVCANILRHRESTILMHCFGHTAVNVPHEPQLGLVEVKECFFCSFNLITTIMPG